MGVKNSALLEDGQYKDLHPGIDADTGEVADVADAAVEAFWHEGQPADLSKGLSLTTVQRFFDYIPRRVFLPWIRALTKKANTDGGRIKELEDVTVPGVLETLREEFAGKVIKNVSMVNNVLTINFTDGTFYQSGSLKGDQGDQGLRGEKGEKGDKGDQGVQGIQGIQGIQGEKGDPYTLTESDKQEMVNEVLAALPNLDEVSY